MKKQAKTDKGPGGAGSASKWLEFSKGLELAPRAGGNAHTGRGRGFVRLAVTASALGLVLAVPGLVAANAVTAVADPVARVWRALPGDLTDTVIASKSEILDRNGNVIAEVWDEGRTNLDSLDGVSWYAQRALIDTEDQRFYEHQGYDPLGTARSALAHSGGGSGITQQLVKNLQFYNLAGVDGKAAATENTLARKIRELKYAVEYEKTHSKDEILLAYFNTVAFGDAGTYSVESASQRFFGVPASGLTLAQASLLVGTVQNPGYYDLWDEDGLSRAKERQVLVLGRMVAVGDITQEDADAALNTDTGLLAPSPRRSGGCAQSEFPFYCEYVIQYIKESPRYGETRRDREFLLSKGGLRIRTYLDSDATRAVEAQLRSDYGDDNRVAVPTVGVDAGTGGVSVYAVNRRYGDGEGATHINLPLNPAGTGSTFKMMVLAAALNSGLTEQDLAFSSNCPLYPGPDWDSPEGGINNSDSCALQGGMLNYRQATAYSSNTWFATLEMRIGVGKVKDFAASVGIPAPDTISERSLSYGLGSTEHSPVDMAAAFAAFSSGGVFCPATPVSRVEYQSDGSEPVAPDTYDPASDGCRRVMSPHSAAVVSDAMRANMDGTVPGAFGLRYRVPGYEVAAKSGSNNTINSTWAVVSSNLALFSNIYDPVDTAAGMDGHMFRGGIARWNDHAVAQSAAAYLPAVYASLGFSPPVTSNGDTSFTPGEQASRAPMVTVPSFVGLRPEEAVASGESLGLNVHVLREKGDGATGRVVSQSVRAGTPLAVGSKREIVLTVGS